MFLDLVDDFMKIPDAEIEQLFIQKSIRYLGAGHYTVKGNQYVADMIHKRLLPLLKSMSYE